MPRDLGRGDGPSAPTLVDDLKQPLRPADLAQSWTFGEAPTREDIFRTMSTGFNGTPMPGFVDALSEEQRWAITDYIVSLSGNNGPAYTNLVVAKHVQDQIDTSKGAAILKPPRWRGFGHRTNHGARARVPSSRQLGDRPGDLRRRVDRRSRPLARHDGGQPARPDCRFQYRPRRSQQPRHPRPAAPAAPTADDPFADPAAAPTTVTPSEFNDAVAQLPSQVPSGARKPYFIFGDGQNSVDLWFFDLGRTEPLQFVGRSSADIAPNDTGDLTGVANYDQGGGRSSSNGRCPPQALPSTPGGSRPLLSRFGTDIRGARQPARALGGIRSTWNLKTFRPRSAR